MEASQPIKHCINYTPSDIAAQRANEHLVYFCAPAAPDTERTGDGKNHYESEKDL